MATIIQCENTDCPYNDGDYCESDLVIINSVGECQHREEDEEGE